jgi:hypothetical protein
LTDQQAAQIYVPDLYDILIKAGYSTINARKIVVYDCVTEAKLWSIDDVRKFLSKPDPP